MKGCRSRAGKLTESKKKENSDPDRNMLLKNSNNQTRNNGKYLLRMKNQQVFLSAEHILKKI